MRRFFVLFSSSALALACSSTPARTSFAPVEEEQATEPSGDFGETAPAPVSDPYAVDPPAPWCGPKGHTAPPAPTGTDQCPSDKNKPGCACDEAGKKAACWTGLRANRDLGVCKDGKTTCRQVDETTLAWGPCEDEVLPEKGAKSGAEACKCFSAGQWKIDNVVPCTVPYPDGSSWIVSTHLDAEGKPACPDISAGSVAPPKKPLEKWSTASLSADCAGHFELCYEIKAGSVADPKASDCSVAKVCVTTDYAAAGVAQELPPLDSWVSTSSACAAKWRTEGGYGEMSVKGLSVNCDAVDDGAGKPYVFTRIGYCPETCQDDPTAPGCSDCATGGSGGF